MPEARTVFHFLIWNSFPSTVQLAWNEKRPTIEELKQ